MSPNIGGMKIKKVSPTKLFKRDYKKLPPDIQGKLDSKLDQLLSPKLINGLKFEKLAGYCKPDIYTIHITGNYKLSMQIEGNHAILRRIGTHNKIDRLP